ncbi:MAG: PD-(D/E)XK nuclease family protein [Terriglobales bacterium]
MEAAAALTLCSHARLAFSLRTAWGERERSQGITSWESPPVFALDDWLEQMWLEAGDRMLLTAEQEHLLWQQLIECEAEELLDVAATAVTAAEAWRLAHAWQLDHAALDQGASEEAAAFSRWYAALCRRCEREGWITHAQLPAAVGALAARGALALPRQLRLAGFVAEDTPPAVQALWAALERAGCRLQPLASSFPAVQVRLAPPAANSETGLARAAAWARQQLERKDAQESGAPVGVIVPDLAQRRSQVEQVFLHAFHPDRVPWDASPRAFHLSVGPPLREAPVVAAALAFVEFYAATWRRPTRMRVGVAAGDRLQQEAAVPLLTPEPIELAPLLATIRSPFLAAASSEANARARLEQKMRSTSRSAWLWPDVLALCAQTCPALERALIRARALPIPEQASHQGWVEFYGKLWHALGWPGERPPDSADWQTLHAWERVLDDFGRLDQLTPRRLEGALSTSGRPLPGTDARPQPDRTEGGSGEKWPCHPAPISASVALARLRHAAARLFQPQAAPAPVQVLGWLEASGLNFTALWVCGLTDETLPAAPRPNPFLPLALQRSLGLPHASLEIQSAFAQRLWDRLRRSSPLVIASHPHRAGDGHEFRPSPLLAGCAPWDGSPPPDPQIPPPLLESLLDAQAPPPGTAELHGGTDLLRDQSACPFRAFAHHRLHASSPPTLEPGIAATTRGTLLHRVLRDLFRELPVGPPVAGDSLRSCIAALAARAVQDLPGLRGRPALADLERRRLTATVFAWCRDVESTRPPFRVLATEEKSGPVPFAGLDFDLRRDRVDELNSGGRVLLDYKSGRAEKSWWDGDRPEQPQVPLYLLTDPDPSSVTAVAFAQVRTGAMKLIQLDRPPETAWRRALEALAAEYLAGFAAVQPRDDGACARCDLHPLCRIYERA